MSVWTWALMPVCALHSTGPSQSYFWQTCLIVGECARWSLGYFLHASKMLHAPSPSLSNCPSPYISFILSLSLCTHSQAGRKSTHTFSLNTLNLNSLLIRRYVTSLTLPSSPSFSVHTPSPAEFNPLSKNPPFRVSFLPHLYLLTALHSLYLFFPFFFRLSVPAPSEEPASTQQPHWKQCLIWKLIKSVFLPRVPAPLLLSSMSFWLRDCCHSLPNEFAHMSHVGRAGIQTNRYFFTLPAGPEPLVTGGDWRRVIQIDSIQLNEIRWCQSLMCFFIYKGDIFQLHIEAI